MGYSGAWGKLFYEKKLEVENLMSENTVITSQHFIKKTRNTVS
jgi:hypothetical protein